MVETKQITLLLPRYNILIRNKHKYIPLYSNNRNDVCYIEHKLNQRGNVLGQLLDGSVVELLDIRHHLLIGIHDEVDSSSLSSVTTRTTNTVNVVLTVSGEVVVDDQRDLLDINSTSEQIGGDQHTGSTSTELLQNVVTGSLLHISVDGRHGEVLVLHGLGQPVDLSAGVAIDDSLGNGEGLVQIAQSLELPGLSLQGHVELLDTLQGQLVLLHQNADGIAHELLGDLQDVEGHGGGEEGHLHVLVEHAEGVVDLLLETSAEHLIGLIEAEQLAGSQAQVTTLDQIVHTTGGTNHHLHSVAQLLGILLDGGSSHAAVHSHVHELGEILQHIENLEGKLAGGGHDQNLALLQTEVEELEGGNAEGSSLSSSYKLCRHSSPTRLGLGNGIVSLEHGQDSLLLNHRGLLKTVSVDSTEEIDSQVQVIEGLNLSVPVGFNVDVVVNSSVLYANISLSYTQKTTIKATEQKPTVVSH